AAGRVRVVPGRGRVADREPCPAAAAPPGAGAEARDDAAVLPARLLRVHGAAVPLPGAVADDGGGGGHAAAPGEHLHAGAVLLHEPRPGEDHVAGGGGGDPIGGGCGAAGGCEQLAPVWATFGCGEAGGRGLALRVMLGI